MAETARPFFSLSPEEAEEQVARLGGKPFHARIIRREVLQNGVLDYGEMTALPKPLRNALAQEIPLLAGREVARTEASDGTIKLLISFPRPKGSGNIETVFMPSRKNKGATLCVSTQVGCPVGCPFCASGLLGLESNLASHEILEQYLRGQALGPLGRSVVMGIGEPLLNYPNLKAALAVVQGELGLGARKITVSSVGFPERLRRIARDEPRFQLALSLHSPDDAQRAQLVPAMAAVTVEELLAAGDDWFAETGREVTYEYVLLGGTNDSDEHAVRLVERLRGRRATVNLIPYNPIGRSLGFARPQKGRASRFAEILTEAGIVATVRWSRGLETDAACGQLRVRESSKSP